MAVSGSANDTFDLILKSIAGFDVDRLGINGGWGDNTLRASLDAGVPTAILSRQTAGFADKSLTRPLHRPYGRRMCDGEIGLPAGLKNENEGY